MTRCWSLMGTCEILTTIAIASVLLRPKVVNLLRTASELLRSRVAMYSHVAHFETSLVLTARRAVSPVVIVVVVELTLAGLLRCEDGLLVWRHRAGAHAVHVLALLRPLMSHHRRSWPSGAWISIRARHCRGRHWSGGHELWVTTRCVHRHLRAALHEGRRCSHVLRTHHHGPPHLGVLLGHVLWVLRKVPHLRRHLRSTRIYEPGHDGLRITQVGWRVHVIRVSHWDLPWPRRRI